MILLSGLAPSEAHCRALALKQFADFSAGIGSTHERFSHEDSFDSATLQARNIRARVNSAFRDQQRCEWDTGGSEQPSSEPFGGPQVHLKCLQIPIIYADQMCPSRDGAVHFRFVVRFHQNGQARIAGELMKVPEVLVVEDRND